MYYFKLYANCIPVKGKYQSIIIDFQRKDIYKIENSFYEVLNEINDIPLKEIKKHSEKLFKKLIELVNQDIAFLTKEPELFPKINEEFEEPSIISNSVVSINTNKNYDYKNLFSKLFKLGCRVIQVRFETNIKFNEVKSVLLNLSKYCFFYVELWCYNNISKINLRKLINEFPILRKVVFFDTDQKDYIYRQAKIQYSPYKTFDIYCKNEKTPIIIDYNFYCESKKFNNCLNKKVAIDSDLKIKNCLSLNQNFGDINETDILEVVKSHNFQKLWHINKDSIDECNLCEYRYICKDCRAFTINPQNLLSKPINCVKTFLK